MTDGAPARPSGPAAAWDLGFARLDLDRAARTGDPEVVYAGGKTADQVVAALGALHAAHPDRAVLATRLTPEAQRACRAAWPEAEVDEVGRVAVLGVPLGLDRYRSLGHAFDGAHLAVRSGSLRRTQANLEGRAVVGWTVRQTWFQRRSRVVTVIAGVGAGSGGYSAVDAGEEQGVDLIAQVTPDWIRPFRA